MLYENKDICDLIGSPEYAMQYKPFNTKDGNTNVKNYILTAGDFNKRIDITFNTRFVEISAFNERNSKYYERLSLDVFAEQFRAERIKKILVAKLAAKKNSCTK